MSQQGNIEVKDRRVGRAKRAASHQRAASALFLPLALLTWFQALTVAASLLFEDAQPGDMLISSAIDVLTAPQAIVLAVCLWKLWRSAPVQSARWLFGASAAATLGAIGAALLAAMAVGLTSDAWRAALLPTTWLAITASHALTAFAIVRWPPGDAQAKTFGVVGGGITLLLLGGVLITLIGDAPAEPLMLVMLCLAVAASGAQVLLVNRFAKRLAPEPLEDTLTAAALSARQAEDTARWQAPDPVRQRLVSAGADQRQVRFWRTTERGWRWIMAGVLAYIVGGLFVWLVFPAVVPALNQWSDGVGTVFGALLALAVVAATLVTAAGFQQVSHRLGSGAMRGWALLGLVACAMLAVVELVVVATLIGQSLPASAAHVTDITRPALMLILTAAGLLSARACHVELASTRGVDDASRALTLTGVVAAVTASRLVVLKLAPALSGVDVEPLEIGLTIAWVMGSGLLILRSLRVYFDTAEAIATSVPRAERTAPKPEFTGPYV